MQIVPDWWILELRRLAAVTITSCSLLVEFGRFTGAELGGSFNARRLFGMERGYL